mgnify:CR=1 FL=1
MKATLAKRDALEMLINHRLDNINEWSEAGLYTSIKRLWNNPKQYYEVTEICDLIDYAESA